MFSVTKKAILAIATSIAIVFTGISTISPAHAATSIGGDIASDTTLTAAGGPYLITSTLRVGNGATLTVEPGAVFDAGTNSYITYFEILSGGTLHVGGSGASVIFRGVGKQLLSNNGNASFDNIQILGMGQIGYLGGAGSSLTDSEIWGTLCGTVGAGVVFSGNVLKYSPCRFQTDVTNNLFIASSDVACSASASSNVTFSNNEFRGFSSKNAICAYGSASIDARGNFWGTQDAGLIAAMIWDKKDSISTNATIDFSLPLASRPLGINEPKANVSIPSKPALTIPLGTIASPYQMVSVSAISANPGGLPLRTCQIQVRDLVATAWRDQEVQCENFSIYKNSLSIPLSGNGQNLFELRYRSRNVEGWSDWSDSKFIVYGQAPNPRNVSTIVQEKSGSIRADSFTGSWIMTNLCNTPYWKTHPSCPVNSFGFRWSENKEGPWHLAVSDIPVTGEGKYQYRITNLKPATLYYFQVGLKNLAGWYWSSSAPAYTAGTQVSRVQILESNGTPLRGATLSWSRNGGGFSTTQPIKTNSDGWATFPAAPAGAGVLTFVDAKLQDGLRLSGSAPFGFGGSVSKIVIPKSPAIQNFNVSVKTVDGTPIANTSVHITDQLEGLDVNLAQRSVLGFIFKIPNQASYSTSTTGDDGVARFRGLVDLDAKVPYYASVFLDAGTISATGYEPIRTQNTEVWLPFLPYSNAVFSHFSGFSGGEVSVSITGHNADFAKVIESTQGGDNERLSVAVLGPDGTSASCDPALVKPVALLDDQGKGQMAFCVRAPGYYRLVGNGIVAGQSRLYLPLKSAPSVPQSVKASHSLKKTVLTWLPPEFNVDKTKLTYTVSFRASQTSPWKQCKVKKLSATCKRFSAGRTYEVRVSAKNAFGLSPEALTSIAGPIQ